MAEDNRTMRRGRMGGGPPGARPVEKAKDFTGTLKKLLKYLGKYKIAIVVVIVCAILSTIFNILGPKVIGNATTQIYEGVIRMISGTGGIDFTAIKNIILYLIGIYVISVLFSYLQSYIMVGVGMNFTYTLRKKISEKINKLPLRYFDKKTHGEVLSYITNDVDTIAQNLNQGITQVITSLTTIIGILIMMLSISWKMTLVALLVLPISSLLIAIIFGKSQKFFKDQQEYLGHVNGHIEEMYSNHNIVKVFNGEAKSIEDFNKYNDILYESTWKSQFLSGLMHPIMNFIGNIGYVVICILGGYYASKGTITVGNIQSFIQYMKQFTHPITQLANVSNVLQSTIAAAERVFEFLDEKEESPDATNSASIENIKGNVEFKHVKFQYDNNNVPTIKDFSANVEAGKTIAIVGPTGARKDNNCKTINEIL